MLHAGLGLMHAIGNVTGGLYHDLPHGLILIRCMDAVLDYNQPVSGEKYAEINPMVDTVRALSHAYQESLNLPDVTVQQDDLSLLAQRAFENVNAQTNPRDADPDAIEAIVKKAFHIP
jgi:alcohol dehydrogenase class IV